MKTPLVTVLMPVYNVEDYIIESLSSIINQTYRNLEILVINDASIDRTLEKVQSFNDERIRIINNEQNKGIPYTRNVGLKEAHGKYIALMDSDDISYPERIEKQVQFMESNLDIDVVGTFYQVFGGTLNGGIFKRKVKSKYITPLDLKIKFLFNCAIHNPTSMLRKDTINKYELRYNTDYFVVQDYDLFVQISKFGKLAILPEVLYKYRVGHSNITKKSLQTKVLNRRKIISAIHNDILKFYGFTFTEEELETYNLLFFDNQSTESLFEDFDSRIISLLVKMSKVNREKGIFDSVLFDNILIDSAKVAISNINIGISSEIKVYLKLCKILGIKANLNHLLYLISKDAYYSIIV